MSLYNARKPLILKKIIVNPNCKLQMHHLKSITGSFNVKGSGIHKNTHNSQLIKVAAIPLYREDVIFESKGESYIPGEYRSVTIINKLNNLTNNCTTIAKCVTLNDKTVEKTSDNLTALIGHEAYNTLFYALCSVINQEYRIKGILALLTVFNSPLIPMADVKKVEAASQTDEIRLDLKHRNKRKRIRKVLAPHIVKPEDYKKRYIVDPHTGVAKEALEDKKAKITPQTDIIKFEVDEEHSKETEDKLNNLKKELVDNELPMENIILPDNSTLHDLGYLQDDSNDSSKTMTSIRTIQTTPELLNNPFAMLQMGANIDKHIKEIPEPKFPIVLADGSEIKLIHKPEDVFHIATKENLEFLNVEDRKKLVFHQLEIDKQHCCTSRDDDGNLPIHLAVINEDIELLKRHCVVLRMLGESVDIPANNGLTALKLAIDYHTSPQSVPMLATLLQNGADSLLTDAEHNCSVHRAAELKSDHLALILHWAKARHREIIMDNEDLQKPGWQTKTQEELIQMLLNHIGTLFDKQGYNPLMLACKHGHYENVKLLLEAAPTSVNLQNPNNGNTALFIGVAAACNVAAERGNKSKIVDHFKKTIEILLDHGADPHKDNNNNFNVSLLLSEFGCTELSNLVLNKIANSKPFGGDMDPGKNFYKYHLVKEGKTVTLQEFKKKPKSNPKLDKPVFYKKDYPVIVKCMKKTNPDNKITINLAQDKKPVIVENILLKSPLEKSNEQNKILLKSQVKEPNLVNVEIVNPKDLVLKTTAKECNVIPLKRKIDAGNTHGKKQKNK